MEGFLEPKFHEVGPQKEQIVETIILSKTNQKAEQNFFSYTPPSSKGSNDLKIIWSGLGGACFWGF
jgi:hypothetical protein